MKYERMFGREYAVRPLGENEFAATWEWKRPHVRYVAVDLGKKEVIYLGHAWRKELRERAKIVAKREFKEFFEKAYDEGIDPKMEEDPFKLDPLAQFVIESDLFGKMTTSEFRELYEEFCEREKRDEEENKVAEEILEENPDLVDCEFPGYYDPNKFGDLIDNKIDEIDEEVGFKTGAWPVNVYFKLKKMAEKKKKNSEEYKKAVKTVADETVHRRPDVVTYDCEYHDEFVDMVLEAIKVLNYEVEKPKDFANDVLDYINNGPDMQKYCDYATMRGV